MKIKIILTSLILTGWVLCAPAQEGQQYRSPVTFIPERVVTGEDVTINYDPASTVLAGVRQVSGVMYLYRDYNWVAYDLDMEKKGDTWTTTVVLPEDAGLLVCKFTGDGKTDYGSPMTYTTFTFNQQGKNPVGAYIGWGVMRGRTSQHHSIPGLVTDTTAMIGDEVLRFWYNNELKYNPGERARVFKYAAETLSISGDSTDISKIYTNLDYIVNLENEGVLLPEQRLVEARDVAQRILRDEGMTAMIEARILANYPDGIVARDRELLRIFRIADAEEKEAEFVKFIKRFPTSDFVDVKTETADMWYAKTMQSVVYNRIVKHDDYSLLFEYIHDLPYEHLATFLWHLVQIPYQNEERTSAQLRPYADAIVDEMLDRPRRRDQLVYSPKEWEQMIYERNKGGFFTYARILSETAEEDKAMEITNRIAPLFGAKTSEFSEFYIGMLEQYSRADEVIPFIEKAVKENAATPLMLQKLELGYKGDDFETYLAELKMDKTQLMRAKIDKELVDLPIELFALESMDGATYDMSGMEGKILVLDFWATWCAPCKAAMPGMNMAVQKYLGDENVEFFFISTMETAKDYRKRIADFITEKGYNDFIVLLDSQAPGAKSADQVYSAYAKAFRFSGIPQKMIIDGNGRLRWLSTGYYGSPSELADEISYIVEKLKKE